MKNITMLIAHPDDEVIFGWPMLKEVKKIICCSSDLNNPVRTWCKDRKKALQEVGNIVGAEVICLDYNSEFYRADARNGDLWKMTSEIMSLLQSVELIYTHNPWGEYGHLDHVLVHQIARASGKQLIYSDMCIEAGWLPCIPWQRLQSLVGSYTNDISFYERCKEIYLKYNYWTWSKDPIMKADLYADN